MEMKLLLRSQVERCQRWLLPRKRTRLVKPSTGRCQWNSDTPTKY